MQGHAETTAQRSSSTALDALEEDLLTTATSSSSHGLGVAEGDLRNGVFLADSHVHTTTTSTVTTRTHSTSVVDIEIYKSSASYDEAFSSAADIGVRTSVYAKDIAGHRAGPPPGARAPDGGALPPDAAPPASPPASRDGHGPLAAAHTSGRAEAHAHAARPSGGAAHSPDTSASLYGTPPTHSPPAHAPATSPFLTPQSTLGSPPPPAPAAACDPSPPSGASHVDHIVMEGEGLEGWHTEDRDRDPQGEAEAGAAGSPGSALLGLSPPRRPKSMSPAPAPAPDQPGPRGARSGPAQPPPRAHAARQSLPDVASRHPGSRSGTPSQELRKTGSEGALKSQGSGKRLKPEASRRSQRQTPEEGADAVTRNLQYEFMGIGGKDRDQLYSACQRLCEDETTVRQRRQQEQEKEYGALRDQVPCMCLRLCRRVCLCECQGCS